MLTQRQPPCTASTSESTIVINGGQGASSLPPYMGLTPSTLALAERLIRKREVSPVCDRDAPLSCEIVAAAQNGALLRGPMSPRANPGTSVALGQSGETSPPAEASPTSHSPPNNRKMCTWDSLNAMELAYSQLSRCDLMTFRWNLCEDIHDGPVALSPNDSGRRGLRSQKFRIADAFYDRRSFADYVALAQPNRRACRERGIAASARSP
jgi:hypothetical protein